MREETETTNWFSRWEEQLPSPEELMPLSQTLITPDLALAFDIPNPNNSTNQSPPHQPHQPSQQQQTPSQPHPPEFDSPEFTAGSNGDEQNRTLKRPRLVWTPQLHKRFVDAVAHLGIKNAVPKTIMQLMSVDGLTRENVASHLQKYRLYLKRMQGLSGGAGGAGANVSPADAAEHHLFASAPVPHHFLHRGGATPPTPDHYLPFVPVLQHHHHQMAAAAAVQQQQQQLYHHRHVGHHFGSPPGGGGGFDHGFLPRQPLAAVGGLHGGIMGAMAAPPYVEDLESEAGGAGRKVLTLFPTGDD